LEECEASVSPLVDTIERPRFSVFEVLSLTGSEQSLDARAGASFNCGTNKASAAEVVRASDEAGGKASAAISFAAFGSGAITT
jgi:hypothetical protein